MQLRCISLRETSLRLSCALRAGRRGDILYALPCCHSITCFQSYAGEALKKSVSEMRCKAHGAQRPRHIFEIGEKVKTKFQCRLTFALRMLSEAAETNTAQHSKSLAQPFIQRFKPLRQPSQFLHTLPAEAAPHRKRHENVCRHRQTLPPATRTHRLSPDDVR